MAGLVVSDFAILGGSAVQATADNAIATASLAAIAGQREVGPRYYLTGFTADYSAALSLLKTITVAYTDLYGTSKSLVFTWDFTNGTDNFAFPGVIACQGGTAASAALAASGTGGKVGSVTLWYFVK